MQFIVKYNVAVNKVSPEISLLDKHDLFLSDYLLSDLLYIQGVIKRLVSTNFSFFSLINIYFVSQ